MSTVGQLAGGLVGGIAGALLGGPTGALYGAQIGLGIGGYLDPAPGPTSEGPRLSDRSVQTSTYGAVIPRIYGTAPVAGNLVWLQGNALTETITKTKKGGKGGGSKTTTVTYSYSATCAFALADTRALGAPFIGIRRIWTSQGLYYDAGSSDPDTIQASNDAAEGFTFYPGSDTQLPDPSIQADIGAANTPAYRGLAYIVFNDLPLAAYGNSLAGLQLKVELLQSGEKTIDIETGNIPYFGGQYQLAPAFAEWGGIAITKWPGNTNLHLKTDDGLTWESSTFPNAGTWICVGGSDHYVCAIGWHPTLSNLQAMVSSDGTAWSVSLLEYRGWEKIATNGSVWCVAASGWICTAPMNGSVWTTSLSVPIMSAGVSCIFAHGARLFMARYDQPSYVTSDDNGVTWTARTFPWGAGWGLQSAASDGATIVGLSKSGMYAKSTDGGVTWGALSLLVPGYTGWTDMLSGGGYFLASRGGDIATSDDAGDTWVATYIPATAGVVYAGDNTRWTGSGFSCVPTNSGTVCWLASVTMVEAAANLGDIVSAECLQSGLLTAADIDVAALTSDVRGYRIGSLGTIRAALEPLRAAWPFDVVQDGYGLRFAPRGGASVVTIPAADLDARPAGESPGVQITTAREMDSQLPRRIEINFLDVEREYDAGLQYDERLNTAATNLETIDLPIVLNATEAAGKAQVLLYQRWLDRYTVGPIRLPSAYAGLQPADVVSLTTAAGLVDLRLTSINYTADNRLEITGKYNSPAIYTPTAVGAAGQATGVATLTPIGASIYQLLDIPLVTDVQAVSGFIAAMYGAKAGWQGGVLMQSTDAGANWAAIDDFGPPGATIGAATNTIGAVESRLIDKASRLTVVLANGDLSSTTELAMLGGANHFAYGAHGRWEIIAAQTCALQSGSTYILSNLLRGRFGTEQHMGAHVAGDSVVLLDADDASFIPISTGSIGLARHYRGITLNRDISTDSNQSFTYSAVNLKPLAPIALTGNRHPSTNDWALIWLRRTRSGGEWRDYVDADLGETSEQYHVDIHSDGSYTAVKRTLTVTAQGADYTSADQVTDFGSNQATLYVKIYQFSPTVGRGTPLTASITR